MMQFIQEYNLLSALVLMIFIIGGYHFNFILTKYLTHPETKNLISEIVKRDYSTTAEIKNMFYDKIETSAFIEHIKIKLDDYVTKKEYDGLERIIDLRFDQIDANMKKISDKLDTIHSIKKKSS